MEEHLDTLPPSNTIAETRKYIQGEEEEPLDNVTVMPSIGEEGKLVGGSDVLCAMRGPGQIMIKPEKLYSASETIGSFNAWGLGS